jgi:hypothetical protein
MKHNGGGKDKCGLKLKLGVKHNKARWATGFVTFLASY